MSRFSYPCLVHVYSTCFHGHGLYLHPALAGADVLWQLFHAIPIPPRRDRSLYGTKKITYSAKLILHARYYIFTNQFFEP